MKSVSKRENLIHNEKREIVYRCASEVGVRSRTSACTVHLVLLPSTGSCPRPQPLRCRRRVIGQIKEGHEGEAVVPDPEGQPKTVVVKIVTVTALDTVVVRESQGAMDMELAEIDVDQHADYVVRNCQDGGQKDCYYWCASREFETLLPCPAG